MILDRMARRVTNSARLTLDSPRGWDAGGSLYDGKTLGAMKLPAVNACIEIISDSVTCCWHSLYKIFTENIIVAVWFPYHKLGKI